MKIAIVGTGIAGNVAAYKLRQQHEITVFEAGAYVGGHTNTVDVYEDGQHYACLLYTSDAADDVSTV